MAKRTKQTVKRLRSRSASILKGILQLIYAVVQSPYFLVGIVVGYYYFNNPGKLKDLLTKFTNNKVFGSFIKLLIDKLNETAGGITVGLSTLSAGNTTNTLIPGILAALATIFVIPKQANFIEYAALGTFISLIWRARSPRLQFSMIFLALLTIALGFWGSSFG